MRWTPCPTAERCSSSTDSLDGSARSRFPTPAQGLTPEECERLFTPYYTTKQHGTGLGLAIVQSVVSDHRGTITVHSRAGTRHDVYRIELKAMSKLSDRG